MFLMVHGTLLQSQGFFQFSQVGINYLDDQNAKTTMLLGLSALMDVLPDAIDGFVLHSLDEHLTLPPLTNNKTEDGFPGSMMLAFKYFIVHDKQNRKVQTKVALPDHSPHRFNDEEDYKPPTAMWGVIQVKGDRNIKEACKALTWNMTVVSQLYPIPYKGTFGVPNPRSLHM
jgi:hypothetical protein